MAVAKVSRSIALPSMKAPINRSVLVVGGGVAGMVSALQLAQQGHIVHLVEKGTGVLDEAGSIESDAES